MLPILIRSKSCYLRIISFTGYREYYVYTWYKEYKINFANKYQRTVNNLTASLTFIFHSRSPFIVQVSSLRVRDLSDFFRPVCLLPVACIAHGIHDEYIFALNSTVTAVIWWWAMSISNVIQCVFSVHISVVEWIFCKFLH